MIIKDIILKYFFVIGTSFSIFLMLNNTKLISIKGLKMIVLVMILTKSFIFFKLTFNKLISSSRKNVAMHNFFAFMFINVIIMMFSFSFDYYSLYTIDIRTFVGIANHHPFYYQFFEFVFFSFFNFSNFGYGQIYPNSIIAKIAVSIEIIVPFIAFAFMLCDFVSLKESLKNGDFKFNLKVKK